MSNKRELFLCGVVEGFYGRPWTHEQRIDLFTRMSTWGMNAYLYAPKDDYKHRAYWRELYNLEEADSLSQLIKEATNKGIHFIYAIAPGLDITFSISEEISLLKRKLEQVATLGCKSFAILFDDIECDMCPDDDKVFPSFAHAQVDITNDIFSHLDHPDIFLFCPTEYCATRAIPTVTDSQYLKHVGAELHPKIDVLWTGPKVISKSIPVSSIDKLSSVLQRPPVIWDNLHANDYDQRRLFLGPYDGRSVALIPKLNGVMTNPNCEYGANYVPIHTLAQWSRCGSIIAKRMSPTDQAMLLEMEKTATSDYTVDCKKAFGDRDELGDETRVYDPKLALEVSLKEWFVEIQVPRKKPEHYKPVKDATSIAKAVDAEQMGSMKLENDDDVTIADSPLSIELPEELRPKMSPASSESFTMDDLRLLVDYFFLPHRHGTRAMHVLQEFCWLKENAPGYELLKLNGMLVDDGGESSSGSGRSQERGGVGGGHDHVTNDGMRSDGETSESLTGDDMSCVEVAQWCERASQFHDVCAQVNEMYERLTTIPNRSLLYDIYQYTWDVKDAAMLMDSFISWLENGGNEVNPQHKPLIPHGGIVAEMQRLVDSVLKEERHRSDIVTIRPYREEDKELVYRVCLETGDSGEDATMLFKNHPNLLGDRYVGPYIHLNPELSYVLEDFIGVCGYVLATLDSKTFYEQFEKEWLPTVISNYPDSPIKTDGERLSTEEELLYELHHPMFFLPATLQENYPAHLHIDIKKRAQGRGCGTNMMKTILSILKSKGVCGVHLEMNSKNIQAFKFYHKLGFTIVDLGGEKPPSGVLTLGKRL